MSYFQFPCAVYSGIDSLDRIYDKDYESVMIISDGNISQKSGALMTLKRKFDSLFTRCEIIISDNEQELFEKAKKYAETHIPEALIAVGGGKTIDCGTAVSALCEIPLVSVIETIPCALSDFDTLDLFLYKKSAETSIIDPSFITVSDSQKIAYEALGMMCLALESAVVSPDRYIASLGQTAFCEIYRNILPSYRGEISARENLCSAMFAAYAAYINSFEHSWQSAAFRIASFFSKHNSDRMSILAVSAVNLSQYLCEKNQQRFLTLSRLVSQSPAAEARPDFITDEIRRIQATLGIPYAVKNIVENKNGFTAESEGISDEDKDLFYSCYYGNVTFIKS